MILQDINRCIANILAKGNYWSLIDNIIVFLRYFDIYFACKKHLFFEDQVYFTRSRSLGKAKGHDLKMDEVAVRCSSKTGTA